MFDHTQTRESRRRPAVGAHVGTTHAEFAALGFDLPNLSSVLPSVGGGLSIPVSVSKTIADKFTAEAFLENLAGLIAKKIPICLQPEDFPDTYTPIDVWQLLCEAIADHLSQKKLPKLQIATCIHSHRMPLSVY